LTKVWTTVNSEFKDANPALAIALINFDPGAGSFLYPANRCTLPCHIFIALFGIFAGLIPGCEGYAAGQNDYQDHQENNS